MRTFRPSEHRKPPPLPSGSGHTGGFVLGLLAIAAFCGWYVMVQDRPSDSGPLRVVQRPLIPPSNTDMAADLPGHTHYIVIGPASHQVDASAQP